jgi:hypothetical protein
MLVITDPSMSICRDWRDRLAFAVVDFSHELEAKERRTCYGNWAGIDDWVELCGSETLRRLVGRLERL